VQDTGASEIAIEYYTDAPEAVEEEITTCNQQSCTNLGKRVIISAPDELGYTDILAYTLLDNVVSIDDKEKIRVYWYATQEDALGYGDLQANDNSVSSEDITKEIQIPTETPESNTSNETSQLIESVNNSEQSNSEANASISGNAVRGLTGNVVAEAETNATLQDKIKISIDFDAYDLDEDGNIDYVEWNVPHLSEQIYEIIIEISKAEELDENRIFVRDVYPEVSQLDGNYTEIPDGHYVRVTFKQNLTNKRDITIYAKAGCNGSIEINGRNVPCAIYEEKMRIDEIKKELENE
jgi:hypothetical protein